MDAKFKVGDLVARRSDGLRFEIVATRPQFFHKELTVYEGSQGIWYDEGELQPVEDALREENKKLRDEIAYLKTVLDLYSRRLNPDTTGQ